MSGEVTDFKNTEYKKLLITMGDIASATAVQDAGRAGWMLLEDDQLRQWRAFHGTPNGTRFVFTFHRPRFV